MEYFCRWAISDQPWYVDNTSLNCGIALLASFESQMTPSACAYITVWGRPKIGWSSTEIMTMTPFLFSVFQFINRTEGDRVKNASGQNEYNLREWERAEPEQSQVNVTCPQRNMLSGWSNLSFSLITHNYLKRQSFHSVKPSACI